MTRIWHTLDCLPVPYAIDRKKLATMGGRSPPRFNAGRPDSFEPCHLHLMSANYLFRNPHPAKAC
jgi:hypothetical protein